MSTNQQFESRTNEISKSLAGILSYTLPLAQFFLQLLPKSANSLFPNQEIFLVTSVLTLVISFLIIIRYKENPHILIQPYFWQRKRQEEFLRRTNKNVYNQEEIQTYMKENSFPMIKFFRESDFTLLLIFIIFSIGLRFVWITISWPGNPNAVQIFEQAIEYSLIIILSVTASTVFYEDQVQKERKEELRKGRISKAISLAIENNAIPSVPQISFIKELGDSELQFGDYIVVVKVLGNNYTIKTDPNVEVLKEVYDNSIVSQNQPI